MRLADLVKFAEELRLWQRLRHPNIVQLFGWVKDPETGGLCAIMGRCDTSLATWLYGDPTATKVDAAFVRHVGLDVAAALTVVQCAGAVHKDVKPANVLLNFRSGQQPQAKLCDFGTATVKRGATMRSATDPSPAGTPVYMAPEQFTGKRMGPRTDVYSFGVLLWAVMERRRPWGGADFATLVHAASAGERPLFSDAVLAEYPAGLVRLVKACWHHDSDQRPFAAEAWAVLRDLGRDTPPTAALAAVAPVANVAAAPAPVAAAIVTVAAATTPGLDAVDAAAATPASTEPAPALPPVAPGPDAQAANETFADLFNT